jgi:hypothetical protein
MKRETAKRTKTKSASRLAKTSRTSAKRHAPRPGDIITEHDPGKRALYLIPIISAAENDLDSSPSDNIKRFLMHVAWHEGATLTTRVQYSNGPAKSFYQFEAFRAKEAMLLAQTLGVADKVATAAAYTKAQLMSATTQLPDYDPNNSQCSYFPTGNLIASLLVTNDQFGTYIARIDLKQFSQAIGSTNSQHADYWAQYWKRANVTAQEKAAFVQEANQVDALIVPQIKQFHSAIDLTRKNNTWLQTQGTGSVTNTYYDRGTDGTYVNMDDGSVGKIEIRNTCRRRRRGRKNVPQGQVDELREKYGAHLLLEFARRV